MKKDVYRRKMREYHRRNKPQQFGQNNTATQLTHQFFMRGGPLKLPRLTRTVSAQPNVGSIAGGGHEHKREIARRLRQKERLRQKYMLNGGFSRRGREIGEFHV